MGLIDRESSRMQCLVIDSHIFRMLDGETVVLAIGDWDREWHQQWEKVKPMGRNEVEGGTRAVIVKYYLWNFWGEGGHDVMMIMNFILL